MNSRNKEIKDKLDSIGPGMCLAKWTQTTIHLGLGHTHSCHHPRTHVISVDEIKRNPSALHNTEYKKERRKEMLEGKRPDECNYCWNVEDLQKSDVYSDRVLKSAESWSIDHWDEITKVGYTGNINPKYLEISFSHVCNFKCSYCMPSVSSQWMEEVERHGGYPTSTNYNNLEWVKEQNKMPIPLRQHNPYIDAFWEWFPDLYKELHTFRLTGGEPLLDKNTFRLLDYIIDNPNPNIVISINTNLCVPDELLNKFIQKAKIITEKRLVKEFSVYTSCEAAGSAAEYIRYGLDYNQWIENFYKFLEEVPGTNVSLMATYNALSVTTFEKFLQDVYRLNCFAFSQLSKDNRRSTVTLDIPYLNNPPHQTIRILTPDFVYYIDKQIEYMETKKTEYKEFKPGFKENEIDKLKRVRSLFIEETEKSSINTTINRKDFVAFVDEHDKRRGTNFENSFPEMKDFYNLCKNTL